jgi:hypothetical protein
MSPQPRARNKGYTQDKYRREEFGNWARRSSNPYRRHPAQSRHLARSDGRHRRTAAVVSMSATMMPVSAAIMAMAIPVRIMPPVIAAVVTIIAPSVVPVTAEIDPPEGTETETNLRRGRPGIEKGYDGKQG